MKILRHRSAFTLLETVICLGIFCLITTISLANLKDYRNQMEEKQALELFKSTFQNAYDYAYLTKQSCRFMVDNKNTIVFNINKDNENGSFKAKIIKRTLPKTMSVYENSSSEHNIFGNSKEKPLKVEISSSLTHKKYTYNIQMGWGEITEAET